MNAKTSERAYWKAYLESHKRRCDNRAKAYEETIRKANELHQRRAQS